MKNKYESMELPPFPEKRSKGRIKGTKVNKDKREGKILFDHKKKQFYVEREDRIYQYCDTMTEAYYIKKQLMENDWNDDCLKNTITKRMELNIKLDPKAEHDVELVFCPYCNRKLRKENKECPYCGTTL